MIKLVDLIFISIPEAFAMSYFIWFLIGRSSYVDHKKIALAALASATALSASFESIENILVRGLFQFIIIVIIYFLVFEFRISETIMSIITTTVFTLASQASSFLLFNNLLDFNTYFSEKGKILGIFEIKLLTLTIEILFLTSVICIIKRVGFCIRSKSELKSPLVSDLSKSIICIFSVLFILIPSLRLFYIPTKMSAYDVIYLIIVTAIYISILSYVSYNYIDLYLKQYKSTVILDYQNLKQNERKQKELEEQELIESSTKIVEMTFNKNTTMKGD